MIEMINPNDKTAPNRWSHILTRFVGETTLKDYYGGEPKDDIAKWSYKVLIKIKEAFIDDDCIAEPLWLESLVKQSEQYSGAIVGGKIENLSGHMGKKIKRLKQNYLFTLILRIFYLKSNDTGRIHCNGETDSNFEAKQPLSVDWVSAGNMCLDKKRSQIYFDTGFLGNMRYEEPDFCYRAKLAGLKIRYTPSAVVYHKFSPHSRVNQFKDIYFRKRNQFFFIFKNKLFRSSSFSITYFLFTQFFDSFFYLVMSLKDKRYLYGVYGKRDGLSFLFK